MWGGGGGGGVWLQWAVINVVVRVLVCCLCVCYNNPRGGFKMWRMCINIIIGMDEMDHGLTISTDNEETTSSTLADSTWTASRMQISARQTLQPNGPLQSFSSLFFFLLYSVSSSCSYSMSVHFSAFFFHATFHGFFFLSSFKELGFCFLWEPMFIYFWIAVF